MDRDTATPAVDGGPGQRASEWIRRHRAVAAPSEHSHDFVWDVTADAHGPFVTDVDGNVLLDFTCHIGAAPLGYNSDLLLDRADAFDLVDPLKIAGHDVYYGAGPDVDDPDFPGTVELMERLVAETDQYDLDTVFVSNSGAEAIENAIKVAYDSRPAARYGITFSGAFHGRTLGALSITRSKPVHTRHFPEISGIREVAFCEDRTCTAESCDCGFFADGESRLSAMLDPDAGSVDPAEVAFVVLEPIQGVGGYTVPSDAFLHEVERLTTTHDIPLIVDEIQSGVGRTGEMWAVDHGPLTPDVIAAGKALRVGATVGRGDLFPDEPNRLGSTWGGGDLLSSMYGVLTLEAIREHDLLENATERGADLKERIRDADLPGVVDVRGPGLMVGVEFDTAERRDDVVEAGVRRGLLTIGCGTSTLRVLPPLDVTGREVELGADLLVDAVESVAGVASAD